ncbi:probable inactive leucine-rich repeat receptor-like protein kinase At3g03770 isoform X3 [Corylus avellana]|uniref:probable inactive leucine-rich repeat receptor-like protein kinase At3g03770 isoform X3 n=1 Tax=Corylus avellana TaxID=13451 RepID=UPI00286C9378|nr:probable inactive leucine-rich repeat receptor-like protein kinase At3g03770 isoform X3 [Corylus avellana]
MCSLLNERMLEGGRAREREIAVSKERTTCGSTKCINPAFGSVQLALHYRVFFKIRETPKFQYKLPQLCLIFASIDEERECFMGWSCLFLPFCFTWSFFVLGTYQLQPSQTQVLLQLRKHLEYPKQLEIWNDHTKDFCSLSSFVQVNITCQDNFVTELRIMGDEAAKVGDFHGFSIPNQTLSESFSMDSFVATLARLTSLRVLSLVSLGIWGQLPDKIHRLSSLEYLDMSSNFLFGSIPPKISTMVKLQTLKLDDNFFNTTIPNWFDSLSNLTILSLRNNQFKSSNDMSGELLHLTSLNSLRFLDLSANKLHSMLPEMPEGVIMVFLSNNSFLGEIPKQYGRLSQLQHLDMSSNMLRGKPPTALFSLPNITYLSIASNMVGGSLPDHLSCGRKLEFVDISNNRLMGGLPSCLSTKTEKRVVKFDGNCLAIDIRHQHAEPYCEPVRMKKQSRGKNLAILVGVIVGIFVVMALLAFGFLFLCRRYCPRGISEQHLLQKAEQNTSAAGFSSEFLANSRFVSEAAKLGMQGLPVCRSFTLQEIKQATNNFDNSAFMGEGSCGKLYKGRLEDGTPVAIRCLPLSKKYSIRNLKLRLDLLAKLRHPHLVVLLGHCVDVGGRDDCIGNKVFLISEYVPRGSFPTYLGENSCRKVFNWSERLAVLIGVAKAVHFLHTGVIPGFFSNRLKTNNILLNEHWMAKLGDYGLSIISEETDKCKRRRP